EADRAICRYLGVSRHRRHHVRLPVLRRRSGAAPYCSARLHHRRADRDGRRLRRVFSMLPGSDIFLASDRVSATFKDPNVYGPFLIFPLLLLLIDFMTRGLRPTALAIMIFLIGGLLLSFSRGAWAHFAISAAIAVALLLAGATEPRMRARILLFSIAALIGTALFVVALISIPRGAPHVPRTRQGDPTLRHRSRRTVLGAKARARRHTRKPERAGSVRVFPHLWHAAT